MGGKGLERKCREDGQNGFCGWEKKIGTVGILVTDGFKDWEKSGKHPEMRRSLVYKLQVYILHYSLLTYPT